MDGESAAAAEALRRLVIACVVVGILFAATQTQIARRAGPQSSWIVCAASIAALCALWLWNIYSTWPQLLQPLWSAAYMMLMFAGVPLAASTWLITRSVARHPSRHGLAHFGFGSIGFFVGVVLGLILGSLPDLARAFA
jgi:hypothetical protein